MSQTRMDEINLDQELSKLLTKVPFVFDIDTVKKVAEELSHECESQIEHATKEEFARLKTQFVKVNKVLPLLTAGSFLVSHMQKSYDALLPELSNVPAMAKELKLLATLERSYRESALPEHLVKQLFLNGKIFEFFDKVIEFSKAHFEWYAAVDTLGKKPAECKVDAAARLQAINALEKSSNDILIKLLKIGVLDEKDLEKFSNIIAMALRKPQEALLQHNLFGGSLAKLLNAANALTDSYIDISITIAPEAERYIIQRDFPNHNYGAQPSHESKAGSRSPRMWQPAVVEPESKAIIQEATERLDYLFGKTAS